VAHSHDTEDGVSFDDDGVWHWHWRNGRWSDPYLCWHPGAWGDAPDLTVAHAAVDAWAASVDIERVLPRAGTLSPWWRIRFLLVHEELAAMLPILRAIQASRQDWEAGLRAIEVHAPAPQWTGALLRLLFPGVPVHEHHANSSNLAARLNRAAVRAIKGSVAYLRARSLSVKPRVLLVSRANAWDGRIDRETDTIATALQARGCDVLTLEQSHGVFASRWNSLWQRPASHLFGDLLHLEYKLWHRHAVSPMLPLPARPLHIEGHDLAPFAETFVKAQAMHQAQEHDTYLQTLPAWLRRWGIQAVVTADENGGEHALKAAALHAGVPVVGVQHGCIHAHHLHYAYPPDRRPDTIPLPTVTCVYGKHERDLLARLGCYDPESLRVTGQPQNDSRGASLRHWGKRGTAGTALRSRLLPPGADTLLLLTSQDLYHGLAAETLLPALRGAANAFLVVRPHPREADGDHWRNYFAEHGASMHATIASGGALEDWLDACDIHVSVCSTVLSEAAVWGRPSIVLAPRAVGDWLGVLEAGVALPLEPGDALAPLIGRIRHMDSTLAEMRKSYVENHFGTLDQGVGARVAEEVIRLVSTS
jgi:hypothetical protein